MAAARLGVTAAPFTRAAHALAVAAAFLVLVWCVCFRGGLALEAHDKNLIFNVSDSVSYPPFPFASCNKHFGIPDPRFFALLVRCEPLPPDSLAHMTTGT